MAPRLSKAMQAMSGAFPPLPDSDSDDGVALPSDSGSDGAMTLPQLLATTANAPRSRRRPAIKVTVDKRRLLAKRLVAAPLVISGDRLRSGPPAACSTRDVILELFAGTGSVGKCFASHGWQVISLDITDKGGYSPTHLANILHWAYTDAYAPHHFRVVWASPPCEHYSLARTTAKTPRDLPFYDSLVQKSLEIIKYFKPEFYFIENPASGLLRTRPVIQGEQWRDVDYCTYGCEYRKRTRLWGVVPPAWQPRPLCRADCWSCTSSGTGKHRSTAQRGSGWSLNQLHHIPAMLMDDIVKSVG